MVNKSCFNCVNYKTNIYCSLPCDRQYSQWKPKPEPTSKFCRTGYPCARHNIKPSGRHFCGTDCKIPKIAERCIAPSLRSEKKEDPWERIYNEVKYQWNCADANTVKSLIERYFDCKPKETK